jgi:hypothetical protein
VFAWLNFLTNNPELDCYCILAPFAIAHPIILVNPFANSPAPIGLKFYARSTDIRGNSAELSTIERRFCSSPAAMRHSLANTHYLLLRCRIIGCGGSDSGNQSHRIG